MGWLRGEGEKQCFCWLPLIEHSCLWDSSHEVLCCAPTKSTPSGSYRPLPIQPSPSPCGSITQSPYTPTRPVPSLHTQFPKHPEYNPWDQEPIPIHPHPVPWYSLWIPKVHAWNLKWIKMEQCLLSHSQSTPLAIYGVWKWIHLSCHIVPLCSIMLWPSFVQRYNVLTYTINSLHLNRQKIQYSIT